MEPDRCRELFASVRVARLATVGPAGPHVVPIVFALSVDRVAFAVDDKPKRTTALRRLANIARDPRVAVLADHYEDDWRRLWWVRGDGTAEVVTEGAAFDAAVDRLIERYDPYREARPRGPVVLIDVHSWSGWEADVNDPPPAG